MGDWAHPLHWATFHVLQLGPIPRKPSQRRVGGKVSELETIG